MHDHQQNEEERGPFGDARPDASGGQAGATPSTSQERPEDRDNVDIVSPDDYPQEERQAFAQQSEGGTDMDEDLEDDELNDTLEDDDEDEEDYEEDDYASENRGNQMGGGVGSVTGGGAGAGGSGAPEDYDSDPVGGGGSGVQNPMRDAPDEYGDGSSGGMR